MRAGWVLGLAMLACGHGPPERYGRGLEDYATPTGRDVTVALRSYGVSRPAIGLSAMPDGGIAMILDGGIEINVCTKATRRFKQIAVVHESPKRLAEGQRSPQIIAWRDTAVLVSQNSSGDTLIILPPDVRVGSSRRESFERNTVPECQASLDSLRNSRRLPDGSLDTDGRH
jgi:hypothetical protein